MSVRTSIWVTHGVVIAGLAMVAATWAAGLASSDTGNMLRIGHALASLVLGVAGIYALLSTALVVALAHRPRDVVAIHTITIGACSAAAIVLIVAP